MDRRQIIKSYFQDRHWDNEKLRVLFLEPIVEELGLDADYAEMVQLFGSVDEIPSDFLEGLGDSVGYEYLQEEDPDIQREIIKRIFQVYKNRAKRSSIERVLESSTDRNWIGDDLTLYKGDLIKGYQRIWLPRDKIFYHDKSRHDSGDAFADYFEYNYGVINFEMQYFDDRTIQMLEKQVPGGVRWNISQLVWVPGDGTDSGHGSIPSYYTDKTWTDYFEDLTLMPKDLYIPSEQLAKFDQLLETYKVDPSLILLGAPLGALNKGLFTGGILGKAKGTVLHSGYFNQIVSKPYFRSGRFVVMDELIEEITFKSSYLSNQYSAGILGTYNPSHILKGGSLGGERGIYNLDGGRLGTKYQVTELGTDLFGSRFDFDVVSERSGNRNWDSACHDDGLARDGLYEDPLVFLYASYNIKDDLGVDGTSTNFSIEVI